MRGKKGWFINEAVFSAARLLIIAKLNVLVTISVPDTMDAESLYDYGEEEQDFYEESIGSRKGYPIDHRLIKVSSTFVFF